MPPCHVYQAAHCELVLPAPKSATQQYVALGLRFLNFVSPFFLVVCVANGVPGRGLELERGVEISTAMFGAGELRSVTRTVADLILGSGVLEPLGVGAGGTLLLLPHPTMARPRARAAKRIETRLGMAGSVRRPRRPVFSGKMRA